MIDRVQWSTSLAIVGVLLFGALAAARIHQASPRKTNAPPRHIAFNLPFESAAALGDANAPVTLIHFSDYQCPFCKRFDLTTLDEIKEKLVASGKVRLIEWDLPLDFHAGAFKAAEAARCAGEQGRFWEMRRLLIANRAATTPEAIAGYVHELPDFRRDEFDQCMSSERYAEVTKRGIQAAHKLGIEATPSFLIGRVRNGRFDGELLVGARKYETFELMVEEAAGD